MGNRSAKKRRLKQINRIIGFRKDRNTKRKLAKILRGQVGRRFDYEAIQRFWETYHCAPLCGYIRGPARELGGQVMGLCSLTENDKEMLCERKLPMDLQSCPTYNLFRRTEKNPYKNPFFIFRDENGYLRMRFKFREKEIAATVYLKGRKDLSLDRIGIEGVCEQAYIEEGKLKEDVTPVKESYKDALKRYVWEKTDEFNRAMSCVLGQKDYQSIRRTKNLKARVMYERAA